MRQLLHNPREHPAIHADYTFEEKSANWFLEVVCMGNIIAGPLREKEIKVLALAISFIFPGSLYGPSRC
jgi:hypothetical protein